MPEPVDEELLSAYLDGETTAEERALVERRLRESGEWRQFLDELKSLRAALVGLPRYALGADLSREAPARIERLFRDAARERRDAARERGDDGAQPAPAPERPPTQYPLASHSLAGWLSGQFRNPRAWLWPIMAVAAAVLMMLFDSRQQAVKVAQAPPATAARPRLPAETSIGAAPQEPEANLAAKPAPFAADKRLGASTSADADGARPLDAIQAPQPALRKSGGRMAGNAVPASEPQGKHAPIMADDETPLDEKQASARAHNKALSPGVAGHKKVEAYKGAAQLATDLAAGEMVVDVQLSPAAAARGDFEKLLASHSIRIEQAPTAQNEVRRAEPVGESLNGAAAAQRNLPGPAAREVRAVGSPAQIAAALAELRQRVDDYAAINVQPAAQSGEQGSPVQLHIAAGRGTALAAAADGSPPAAQGQAAPSLPAPSAAPQTGLTLEQRATPPDATATRQGPERRSEAAAALAKDAGAGQTMRVVFRLAVAEPESRSAPTATPSTGSPSK